MKRAHEKHAAEILEAAHERRGHVNICIVIPYLGGQRAGSPDVIDLAAQLQKRGHTVIALTGSYADDLLYEEQNGVKIFRVRPLLYLSKIDYGISLPILELRKLIKSHNIEIIHGVMEFGTQTVAAALLSRTLKRPFILTIQGAVRTSGIPAVDVLVTIFDHTVAKLVSLNTRKAIIISENLRERAHKIGFSSEKIRVVPTSIPYSKEFNPHLFASNEIRRRLGLENKIIVCFIGRLVRLKGLVFLLRALKTLQKSVPGLHLFVVGYGPDRLPLEGMSKKFGLNSTFIGYVERSKIPLYMAGVDIFVNPSLSEGLPLTVMEAMAMEKAVVATDVGGTSDLVRNGENGFLVPPGDVKSLANGIKRLALDNRMRLTMGVAGRNIILKDFDWDSIASEVEKVYEEALLQTR